MEGQFEKGFKQFRLGSSLFFAGLVVIHCANQLLQPSLVQELCTGLGVLIIVTGFIMAILAEGRLVLARFLGLFYKK